MIDGMPKPSGWCRTSEQLLAFYESKILSHITAPYKSFKVPICLDNNKNSNNTSDFINTLEMCTQAQVSERPPLVMIHGFASALGVFVNSYAALSSSNRVFGIDLLGFGRSSKPRFPSKTGDNGRTAELIFVDSIESWRSKMGLGPIIICAHSFGGYLATSYACRYPQNVAGLILVDPWGFPPPPDPTTQPPPTLRRRMVTWLSGSLRPLDLLRSFGPLAPTLFARMRRDLWEHTFAGIGEGDQVRQYLYHSNVQATGDQGFSAMLAPLAFARRPFLTRLAAAGMNGSKLADTTQDDDHGLNPNIPVTFIYGAESWIDSDTGNRVRALRGESSPTYIEVIPEAGHHVYAEQTQLFVAAVLRAVGRAINHRGETCKTGSDTAATVSLAV